jgi:hypothetical protein
MSGKVCSVCGRLLSPGEVRLNERRMGSGLKKTRYLCAKCRQRDYNAYVSSMKKLIYKK